MGALDTELEFYEAHKDEILEHHAGLFVLISGSELLGAFTTEAEAYEAGLAKLGNRPFLIKRAVREEAPVQFPALTLSLINADLQ